MTLMKDSILTRIIADKKKHVSACKSIKSLSAMEDEAEAAPPLRPFYRNMATRHLADKLSLITEIKKASPSAGLIVKDFDPARLAKTYEQAGATCLSVLTDTPYFQGEDDHLKLARAACSLPVLRKDFMIDSYQIVESRALGADCVLIIMACLSNAHARELIATASSYDLSILIEVHDEEELDRALPLAQETKNAMIGINNRDLKTLQIDLATTDTLIARANAATSNHLSANHLFVSESGIRNRADIHRLKHSGVSCFLIGEHLLKSPDVGAATRAMLAI